MSWSGLSNSQIVSNSNLNNAITNSVFTRRDTFTANSLMLTKSRAQSYVYLNENSQTFYGKANNQLVSKQDLVAATIISCGTGTYGNILWTANSSVVTTAFFDVGTTSGTLTIDYVVNSGAASLTVEYGGSGTSITNIVSSNGSTTYNYTYNASYGNIIGIRFGTRQSAGTLQSFDVRTNCSPIEGIYDFGTGVNICSSPTSVTTYRASGTSFQTGTILYTNSTLTTPVTGYSRVIGDNNNIWVINGSTGEIGSDTGIGC